MPIGVIGKKLGMTRIFTEAGTSIPVTVVHAPKNYVTQVKTLESDGYFALQLSAVISKVSKSNKATAGHYAKAGVPVGNALCEFRVAREEIRKIGETVEIDAFNEGETVDVTGVSKGKGFAGAVKRHNFHTQDATHGNSLSHRALGSTGQCQFPGRVFKGKKMAGHMGAERVTTKNLEVVSVDADRELLLLKGAVPGAVGSEVWVKHQKIVLPPEPKEDEVVDEEAQVEAVAEEENSVASDTVPEAEKTTDEQPQGQPAAADAEGSKS